MIRKYSFRKLRGVGLVSCIIGFTLVSGLIQQNYVSRDGIVHADTSSTEDLTLSNLINTRVQRGIFISKLTNSSDFTVDSSITQDKLPAIQALKDVYDKLPESYRRIVQGVHFINQEDGVLGLTDSSRNTYIRANYFHPDLHPDFSDAYEVFFHEIAHSIDFLSYTNDNGQEYSISRSPEISTILKDYSTASVPESFASTFGGWLQSKVMDRQPKDATEQTLWNLYDHYFNRLLFNTPILYDEVQKTTFNWVGHFKDEYGNTLRPDIKLSNNYSRSLLYMYDSEPIVDEWKFVDRTTEGMDDLSLQPNKFNYQDQNGQADAWSTFTVPSRIGDKYLFKDDKNDYGVIGVEALFTWQDKIFNEIGKQGRVANGEQTFYYKAKDGKITLRLADADNPSVVYAVNEQKGFKNYGTNPIDTTVFDSYSEVGKILDEIPSNVPLANEDITIDIRLKDSSRLDTVKSTEANLFVLPSIDVVVRDNTDLFSRDNGVPVWKALDGHPNGSFMYYNGVSDPYADGKNKGLLWALNASTSPRDLNDAWGTPITINTKDNIPSVNLEYYTNVKNTVFKLKGLSYNSDDNKPKYVTISPALNGYRTYFSPFHTDKLFGYKGLSGFKDAEILKEGTKYKINLVLSNDKLNQIVDALKDKKYYKLEDMNSDIRKYIIDNFTTSKISDLEESKNSDKLLFVSNYNSIFWNLAFKGSDVISQQINQGDDVDYSKSLNGNYASYEVVKGIDNMTLGNQTATIKVNYEDGSSEVKNAVITVNKVVVDKVVPLEFKRIITVNLPNGEKNVVTQVVNGTKTIKVNKFDENDVISEGEVVLNRDTFESYQPTSIDGYSTPKAEELKVDTNKQVVESELSYAKVNSEPKNDDIKNSTSSDNKDTKQTNKDLTKTITNENANISKSNAQKASQTEKDLPQTNYSSSGKALTYGGLGIIASVLSVLGITKLKKKQRS